MSYNIGDIFTIDEEYTERVILHCLTVEGLSYVQHYPSLVQHKAWVSTIDNGRSINRQTDSFKE